MKAALEDRDTSPVRYISNNFRKKERSIPVKARSTQGNHNSSFGRGVRQNARTKTDALNTGIYKQSSLLYRALTKVVELFAFKDHQLDQDCFALFDAGGNGGLATCL